MVEAPPPKKGNPWKKVAPAPAVQLEQDPAVQQPERDLVKKEQDTTVKPTKVLLLLKCSTAHRCLVLYSRRFQRLKMCRYS